MHYKNAIVRPPCINFDQGITSTKLGAPDLSLALEQHHAYCKALETCGVSLVKMEPDTAFPDSTFVEDTAVLACTRAILTRPGAETRRGEVPGIELLLAEHFERLDSIQPPGTLDGGDVCQVDDHYFIGISSRTNADGAQQLASFLARDGFSSSLVNLDSAGGLLHLKSGLAYLGNRQLVMARELEGVASFKGYEIIYVDQDEFYAANCLKVNDFVLVAAGFPKIAARLTSFRYQVLPLDVSEFQKMDGGLSCLSLRF